MGARPHTAEELREKATAARAVIEEMQADAVLIFTDGPYVETKEHLGGFAVVDVPDDAAARYWAGRLATVLDLAAGGAPVPRSRAGPA
ncbi:YciI family protein [Micromonospora sp. I033]